MSEKAVVLFSGGMDSATALWWAKSQGWNVIALEFDHKDRPNGEREACKRLCEIAKVSDRVEMNLPFIEVAEKEGWYIGFIPLRNLIYYALAASVAYKFNAKYLVGGHLKTDGAVFKDAQSEYFALLNKLIVDARSSKADGICKITLPFINIDKSEVVALGRKFGVPFEHTWSCMLNEEKPCGKCIPCTDREKAFNVAADKV